ncbi:MAG: alcohol dehydrogenase catalytic domain-containing protein [Streptosporangiales bacterium]|nr:alcohol dehydrogenase catalytic domain-containing protein [Streptosporangiales bacterium]
MRALTKLGPAAIDLVDRPARALDAGLVRLEVTATGVCGTDLHLAADEYPCEPPVTMGHEITGIVTEVGSGVSPTWIGRQVACETYFSACETCRECRDGRRNLCRSRRSLGSFEDGGFAPEVVLPALNLHVLPPGLEPVLGVLCEPLACLCNCLLDPSRIAAGDRVLVIGPGALGLLAVQLAAAQGARVTCAGLPADRRRLDVSADLGAQVTTDPPDEETFDVVVECSGAAGGIAAALRAARRRARIVQVGIRGSDLEVPWDLILYKELEVSSGFGSTPASWRRAMDLVAAGSVRLDGLVSDLVPLTEWRRAFALVGSPETIKVALDPQH